jgi:hypothetical protein
LLHDDVWPEKGVRDVTEKRQRIMTRTQSEETEGRDGKSAFQKQVGIKPASSWRNSVSRSADFTKSVGDMLWRFRARIHPLQIGLQLPKVVDQVELVGPIDKIRGDAISDCDAIPNDESTPFKMRVENCGHSEKLFFRQYNVRWKTLVRGCSSSVTANMTQR